jgi:electron transfer flavoprotein beta subunit
LGHGLEDIVWLNIGIADDPLTAISAELALQKPDIVLAGRRGQGGADTGMLPYRVARACKMTIAADAVAVMPEPDGISVVQALPKAARRRLLLTLPAVITTHESAPPALPFVYRARLTGRITEKSGLKTPSPAFTFEERPYRRRPKLIGESGGSAEERLRAATEQKSAGGKVMINPAPAEAAAAILDYLARVR